MIHNMITYSTQIYVQFQSSKHRLLLKYFKRFCSAYNIEGTYGEKNSDLLFSHKLKHNPSVSCNIHNNKEINDIVM